MSDLRFRILYELAVDGELQKRMIAAAVVAGVADPEAWVYENRWRLAMSEGWVEAFETALEDVQQSQDAEIDLTRPELASPVYGISDAQIEAAVVALHGGGGAA